MIATLLSLLIGCGLPIGQATTAYDACLDAYEAQRVCGDEAPGFEEAHEECAVLLPEACAEGDQAACEAQAVYAAILPSLNCYNAHYADTCDPFTADC